MEDRFIALLYLQYYCSLTYPSMSFLKGRHDMPCKLSVLSGPSVDVKGLWKFAYHLKLCMFVCGIQWNDDFRKYLISSNQLLWEYHSKLPRKYSTSAKWRCCPTRSQAKHRAEIAVTSIGLDVSFQLLLKNLNPASIPSKKLETYYTI